MNIHFKNEQIMKGYIMGKHYSYFGPTRGHLYIYIYIHPFMDLIFMRYIFRVVLVLFLLSHRIGSVMVN